LKNFKISLISFGDLAGIEEGIDEIEAGLTIFLPLPLDGVLTTSGLNLDFIPKPPY